MVAFTSLDKEVADPIIDLIDPFKLIFTGRFYKEHCTLVNGVHVKDLRGFSEWSLEEILIVDHSPASFALQLDNGVPIKQFNHNDHEDKELMKLLKYLKSVAGVADVRKHNRHAFKLRELSELCSQV